MVDIEIFTPTGVLVGTTEDAHLTHREPELEAPTRLEAARWYPIDGSPPTNRGEAIVAPDDILLIFTPEPEIRIHMASYSVALEVGPYHVSARLATHPGFDPERALARPGGTFVALSDATIELLGSDDSSAAERPCVHVNRYAVDRATSSLMLGHYFPGARLATRDPIPVA